MKNPGVGHSSLVVCKRTIYGQKYIIINTIPEPGRL